MYGPRYGCYIRQASFLSIRFLWTQTNRMVRVKKSIAKATFAILLGVSLSACGGKTSSKKTKAQSAQQALPITVVMAKKQKVDIIYKSVGSFVSETNPDVKAETTGSVTAVKIHAGENVKKNQLLVQLSNSRQEIAYKKALAQKKAKAYAEERYQMLAKKGIVSQLQYQKILAELRVAEQELASAQDNLNRTQLKSKIDGRVQHVYVSIGDFVSEGDKLVSVINAKNLQAHLPFSQSQAKQFKVGQAVKIYSPTSPNYMINGFIDSITPSVNPQNRSFNVIVKFSNPDNIWRAGASSHAQISLEADKNAFIVPKESLVLNNLGDSIFIVQNNKAVEIRNVQIINEEGNNTAITAKGLKEGDLIVVDGAPYLSNGVEVSIKKPKKTTSSLSSSKTTDPNKNTDKAANT